jgi:hypothetical protein
MGTALLSLLLFLGVLWTSLTLHHARTWIRFNSTARDIIADYGPSLTLIAFTVLAHAPQLEALKPQHITTPSKFGTTSGRNWLVPFLPLDLPGMLSGSLGRRLMARSRMPHPWRLGGFKLGPRFLEPATYG